MGENGSVGFTTPLKPFAPDEMWCVWHSDRSGVYEWICGEQRAAELLNGGMTHINGHPVTVEVVGEMPELRGIQVRASISRADGTPSWAP